MPYVNVMPNAHNYAFSHAKFSRLEIDPRKTRKANKILLDFVWRSKVKLLISNHKSYERISYHQSSLQTMKPLVSG